MQIFRPMAIAAFTLMMPLSSLADQPNLQPGEWEFTSISSTMGHEAPEEDAHTERGCITENDIAEGARFLIADQGCEITDMESTPANLAYSMICEEDGDVVEMRATFEFMSDSLTGRITSYLDTSIGKIPMHTEVKGQRLGECD
ncbi:hypothetical protein M911_08475 [Ectothiorhodospira haloalkaliphila]|uniref:DUF3617 domain-containing protein n=1 Tax=Ectothiorhodospira haloalkaliphila TaxID=421628 RepID=W8KYS1_9GAMM|nr:MULTISPECIES: DUF3617 family protein [Ectothiorhodospira]AHK80681.1 hypothetical protein M911_08475 [Ectothiorhodospira haloalkaliphila]MCG5493106.1 DUF3617 domain-containing protein [Ectothiorhodospira variabilis]MCG5497173.1 DUF3617 domain-containing protein [Ectothiorhodospira variabilis]MCG5502435.1 DUF3617 domain-containing protein [Ectothiorhodospira variabilis]MCG5505799.1 DUF3617 domain-containing protein [Ectothiorhodospira variabilis]